MKKALLIVLVVIVLAILSIPLWIDRAARSAIEVAGSDAMGVATTLDSIDIGLFGGEATLESLHIANPDGFSEGHFLAMDGGTVAVDLGTVMDDEVVIPTLTLTGLRINLERNLKGSNYRTLMKNLESGAGEADGEGKRFVIKELVIKDIKVVSRLSLGVVKPGVPLVLDEMRFQNIGSDGSGVSMQKVFGYVITGLLKGIAQAGTGVLPDEITKGLGEGLGGLGVEGLKVVGKGGKSIIEGVGKGIGGLFGKKKKTEENDK